MSTQSRAAQSRFHDDAGNVIIAILEVQNTNGVRDIPRISTAEREKRRVLNSSPTWARFRGWG